MKINLCPNAAVLMSAGLVSWIAGAINCGENALNILTFYIALSSNFYGSLVVRLKRYATSTDTSALL